MIDRALRAISGSNINFGATKAEMDLINFGHTARLYVKREKGVVKKFEVRLPVRRLVWAHARLWRLLWSCEMSPRRTSSR